MGLDKEGVSTFPEGRFDEDIAELDLECRMQMDFGLFDRQELVC